jgi:RNA polymerase sigma-70 factor (ECF subfamily)
MQQVHLETGGASPEPRCQDLEPAPPVEMGAGLAHHLSRESPVGWARGGLARSRVHPVVRCVESCPALSMPDAGPDSEPRMNQPATVVLDGRSTVGASEFDALYKRHAPAVHALLQRLLGPNLDAEDVLQEVFLIAWRKRKQLAGDAAFSFLCRTAIHRARDVRARARVRRCFKLMVASPAIDRRDPQRLAEQHEASRIVYGILEQMSEKRRTVFLLFEVQGMSGAEIAQHLGCAENTVWTRLFHARREFLERLKKVVGAVDAAAGTTPERGGR